MNLSNSLKLLGPGFVIAATGLGAGDLIAATVSGAKLGTLILWSVLLGAIIKWVLNEGLARWQLVSGTSLLEGWQQHLPGWVSLYFLAFLVLWSVIISAALMAACGLAAHAILPALSINTWGLIHSLVALILVLIGRYSWFENMMKILIGMMFITVLSSVIFIDTSELPILSGLLIPRLPAGDIMLVLGVIGGVGGSVTLMCYGYWMAEKGWNRAEHISMARIDISVAYSLTALFGICIMILAAKAQPESVKGTQVLLALATELKHHMGSVFYWLFLGGFWGAVFSSMLGVWQGVPYLFADFVKHWKQPKGITSDDCSSETKKIHDSMAYKGFLFFLALPPFALLLAGKPVWLVLVYSVTGALFMPFLAITLLYLNNLKIDSNHKNKWLSNAVIGLAVLLFLILAAFKFIK